MVDVFVDRRVTRSLSHELQARAAAHAQYTTSFLPSRPAQPPQHIHYEISNAAMTGTVMGAYNTSKAEIASMDGFAQRNTTEEILLRNFLDNGSMGLATNGLDAIGISQPASAPETNRGNSEELFSNWISTTTAFNQDPGYSGESPVPNGYRTRKTPRRLSSELVAIIEQQNNFNYSTNINAPIVSSSGNSSRAPYERVDNWEQAFMLQASSLADTDIYAGDHAKSRTPNGGDERGPQTAPDLSQLKAAQAWHWFNSSVPMTRNRSSELRRKFSEMAQAGVALVQPDTRSMNLANPGPGSCMDPLNQALGAFSPGLANGWPLQVSLPSSPQRPTVASAPLSPVKPPPINRSGASVSAVVSMLKGSLERKKMAPNLQGHQWGTSSPQPSTPRTQMHDDVRNCTSSQALEQSGPKQPLQNSELRLPGGQSVPKAGMQLTQATSDSSGGAPSLSVGMANSDGTCTSGQTVSTHRNKGMNSGSAVDQPHPGTGGNHPGPSSLAGPCTGDPQISLQMQESFRKKPDHLKRMASITSSVRSGSSVDAIEDATKKRRVERQRKMAEAKERGSPLAAMPADLQASVKRCEALEKEVRSLKLNLSFMNRKDSEQTKRIEELEEQNEGLQNDKERLLEELEQIRPGGTP